MSAYEAVWRGRLGGLELALGLRFAGEALAAVDWLPPQSAAPPPADAAAARALAALDAYAADPRRLPALPLAPAATPFQARVRAALRAIPPGRPLTYGALAARLCSAPRAVGGACRRNPLPVVVPCHRVVGREGPGGFAGAARGPLVALKLALLRHEGWRG